jgi:hypothetical protein
MKYAVEMASCGMINIPSFMKTSTGVQAILRFCFRIFRGCSVDITDGKGFMNCMLERGSDAIVCMPSFIKIGSGIQKLIGQDIHTQTAR